MNGKRSRPNQKRGDLTREKLVRAGMQALLESNVYGLRISQVAKIAGVPQSLVDYHFKDIETLLMAMVLYGLEKLKANSVTAIETNAGNPRAALAAYVRVPFELGSSDVAFRAVWTSYLHLSSAHKTFGDLNRAVRQGGRDRIQMLIQAILMNEGRTTPQPGVTTGAVADAIQGLITGCGSIAASESGGSYESMAAVAVRSCDQLIDVNFPKN